MSEQRPPRRRDPTRKTRILESAAELIAAQGYHTVGMADIGAAAGIVGSAIYRHFDSKAAILAALLQDVMDGLERAASEIVGSFDDDRAALTDLIVNHVRVATADRRILQVYHREAHNLPEESLRRLRRAQRLRLGGEHLLPDAADLRGTGTGRWHVRSHHVEPDEPILPTGGE